MIKGKFNYVVEILRNWEKESVLTLEDIDWHNDKRIPEQSKAAQQERVDTYFPKEFELDITAG